MFLFHYICGDFHNDIDQWKTETFPVVTNICLIGPIPT